jgi:hypothetical protein
MREEGQEERAREEARKDDGGESQRGEGRGWCVWVSLGILCKEEEKGAVEGVL